MLSTGGDHRWLCRLVAGMYSMPKSIRSTSAIATLRLDKVTDYEGVVLLGRTYNVKNLDNVDLKLWQTLLEESGGVWACSRS